MRQWPSEVSASASESREGETTLLVHLARRLPELQAVLELGREAEGRSSDFVNVEAVGRQVSDLLSLQELMDSPRAERGVRRHRQELQLRPLRDADAWDAYSEELHGPFLELFVGLMVAENSAVRMKMTGE